MAKATPAASAKEGGKPSARTTGRDARAQRTPPAGEASGTGNYLASVMAELRKVTWPTVPELVRMTQVVIATVILFALLIGGFDFVLGYIAKPLYTQPGTAAPQVTAPAVPTLRPATPAASSAASAAPATSHSTATP